MHRPLWQILLTLLLVGFAVRQAAVALVAGAGGLESLLPLGLALQAAAAGIAAVGLWRARRWAIGAVLALGAAVALTALLGGFAMGGMAPLAAVGQVAVAVIACGGFALILRHELGADGTARR